VTDESYTAVRGTIQEVRPEAVLFAVGTAAHGCRTAAWIPRSLIHGADERTLDCRFAGEETTVRIFDWKVKALGWQAERSADGASRDLFGG
jgi:hypothetical protein